MNDYNTIATQQSLDWYRIRLGKFTGSCVGKLMQHGRKKDDIFGETAKSYIMKVAGERTLNPEMVSNDEWFAQYIEETNPTTYAMQRGIAKEAEACDLYAAQTGYKLGLASSVVCPDIPYFASSPDRVVFDEDGNVVRCVEVKSPGLEKFVRYWKIEDGDDLKDIAPDYYWQVQAEMVCTDTDRCDFVAYFDFSTKPLHIATINRHYKDCELMLERVKIANSLAEDYIKKFYLQEV